MESIKEPRTNNIRIMPKIDTKLSTLVKDLSKIANECKTANDVQNCKYALEAIQKLRVDLFGRMSRSEV